MSWPHVLTLWTFDPSIVIGVVLAAVLYWRGRQPLALVRGPRTAPGSIWNAVAFYGGLLVVVVALESPIDALSTSLFSFHMIQHLLLIMVAAPLLLLGDPGITILRGVPLQTRRQALRVISGQGWVRRLGHTFGWAMRPQTVFVVFLLDLYFWHWTWLFNLTLTNGAVHLVEHLCFLITALLFWSQVIDQRAIHPRLTYLRRAIYVVITAFSSNILAMYLVFTPKPLYAAYAHLAPRPYGLSALADQQIAGAIMWVPVLFLFGGAFAVCLYKALGEDDRVAATPGSVILPGRDTPYSMPF